MHWFCLFFIVFVLAGVVCVCSVASESAQQLCLVPSGKIELPELGEGVPSPGVFQPVDYWMGLYYGKTRIGYMHVKTTRGEFEGKKVLKGETFIRYRLLHDGTTYGFDFRHTCYGSEDFKPVADVVRIDNTGYEGAPHVGFELRYGPDRSFIGKMTSEGESKTSKHELSEEDWSLLLAGRKYGFGALSLRPGDTAAVCRVYGGRLWVVGDLGRKNSSLQASFGSTTSKLAMVRQETIEVAGKKYDTAVVKDEWHGRESVRWELASGEVIREELPGGKLAFVRESKADAEKFDAADPPDAKSL